MGGSPGRARPALQRRIRTRASHGALSPTRELADRLGERAERDVERELWEPGYRDCPGKLPDQQDPLPEAEPTDWRTAPAELARIAPDRPELPAAERVLLDIGADTIRPRPIRRRPPIRRRRL
jgi:hypothetical protein